VKADFRRSALFVSLLRRRMFHPADFFYIFSIPVFSEAFIIAKIIFQKNMNKFGIESLWGEGFESRFGRQATGRFAEIKLIFLARRPIFIPGT
jgi:hypothetical protein